MQVYGSSNRGSCCLDWCWGPYEEVTYVAICSSSSPVRVRTLRACARFPFSPLPSFSPSLHRRRSLASTARRERKLLDAVERRERERQRRDVQSNKVRRNFTMQTKMSQSSKQGLGAYCSTATLSSHDSFIGVLSVSPSLSLCQSVRQRIRIPASRTPMNES